MEIAQLMIKYINKHNLFYIILTLNIHNNILIMMLYNTVIDRRYWWLK